jgi:glycosyltransferase involved in cell wall biosynthesis
MPKVSVIIPCFNLGQYLNEAVESVLRQTYRDFEIIIVNDGSTDEFTNNLLSSYDKPKTKVLTTENQGLPSARNNGILISNGDYICCLDADDKYHPEFLEKTVKVLDQDADKKCGFVTTWMEFFGEKNGLLETSDYKPYVLFFSNVVHVASLFRKECWEKKGGYSTNLHGYQDWDFWIYIIAEGYQWHCIHEPLFRYRVRMNSMITNSNKYRYSIFKQIIENNKSYYLNNYADILAAMLESLDVRDALVENLVIKANKKDVCKSG